MKRFLRIIVFLGLLLPLGLKANIDSTTIRELLHQAEAAMDEADFQRADSLAYEALSLSERINDIRGKAKSWRTMGFSAENQANWAGAYRYYLRSLEYWQSVRDSLEMGRLCQDIAIMKDSEGDYSNQIKFAERGFSIFKQIQDTMRMGDMAIDLANAYKNVGNFSMAQHFYHEALRTHSSIRDTFSKAIAAYGLSDLYYKNDLLDSARFYLEGAISVFRNNDEMSSTAQAYNVLGAISEAQGQHQNAITAYRESVSHAQEVGDSLLLFDAFLNLARIETYVGEYDQAKTYFDQAEKLLSKSGGELDRIALEGIADTLEIFRLEKSKRRTTIFASVLGLVSVVLISIISFLKRGQKRKRENEEFARRQEKIKHESEIRELLHEIDQTAIQAKTIGEYEERQRLKKLVHNDIGSQLAATRWRLQPLISEFEDKKQYQQELETIEKMIQQAFKNSRNIERLLEKDQIDWLTEIRIFFDSLSTRFKHSKPKLRFLNNGLDYTVFPAQGRAVKQIIHIATANTLLHATADNFTCQLNQVDEELIILIEDDGKGFDPLAQTEGNGIENLKELVKQLHGQVQIDSQINKGTSITITIPVKP